NNRAVIDQPAAYEALQYLVDLRDKHKVAAPSSVVATAGDFQMFMSGQLAFYQGGPWLLKAFRGIKDFKWDVVPIPGNKAHYTNLIQGLSYIYAKTRYPKESWEWVKFISGPDGQRIRTEMGQGVPSIKALANSSLFLDRTQPPKGIKTIIDVMKNAKLMFNQPRSGEIFVALAQNLDSMWVGNESAKEATARTAQALNKILQEK
ncbi:MAG: extracellular solute-binding protein, partial [Bacteroidota bacterium]